MAGCVLVGRFARDAQKEDSDAKIFCLRLLTESNYKNVVHDMLFLICLNVFLNDRRRNFVAMLS